MSDDALALAPATEQSAAVRSGKVGSLELLELYLDRIERLDPPLNAVVTLDAENARAQCRAADDVAARRRRADDLPPLHGLPFTVKDAIETAGIRSTGGARELAGHVPERDAPAVARLKEAGAIVFGKTNLPRWSGDTQTFNEIFGTTNNPWDVTRTPGGSSGGAAVAVACGFTSFELGTDIGGSIRTPAHYCGIFGLKPSYGIVPQRGYLDHVGGGLTNPDINVFGPIARSAGDLELLLGPLAGPDGEFSRAWRLELPTPKCHELHRARVAFWFDEPGFTIDDGYRAVLDGVITSLADCGAHVEAAHPPIGMADQVNLYNAMVAGAMSLSMPSDLGDALGGFHRGWLELEKQRAVLRAQWAEWFASWDVLLCPVSITPAIPHDQDGDWLSRTIETNGEPRVYIDNVAWAGLIGNAGLPAAVAPVGMTASGLPVGVQVVAPFLEDRTAINLAGALAEALDGAGYRPPPAARPVGSSEAASARTTG